MKTFIHFILERRQGRAGALPYRVARAALFWSIAVSCGAQTVTTPAPTPYRIVARSGNSRIWQGTNYILSASSDVISRTRRITELCSGVCYFRNGQWNDSIEEIDPSPAGAVARYGQHQVSFANNLNSAGAIDVTMPNGNHLAGETFHGNQYATVIGLGDYAEASSAALAVVGVGIDAYEVGTGQEPWTEGFASADASLLAFLVGGPAGATIGASYFLMKDDINFDAEQTFQLYTDWEYGVDVNCP